MGWMGARAVTVAKLVANGDGTSRFVHYCKLMTMYGPAPAQGVGLGSEALPAHRESVNLRRGSVSTERKFLLFGFAWWDYHRLHI